MGITDMLKKLGNTKREPKVMLETGTTDGELNALRNEDIKFQESEEKEYLKEKLRLAKKKILRKNMFGIDGDVEDEVDINNPKVNINKSDVDIMHQKNIMYRKNLLNQKNVMVEGAKHMDKPILKQRNLFSNNKKKDKKNIGFL